MHFRVGLFLLLLTPAVAAGQSRLMDEEGRTYWDWEESVLRGDAPQRTADAYGTRSLHYDIRAEYLTLRGAGDPPDLLRLTYTTDFRFKNWHVVADVAVGLEWPLHARDQNWDEVSDYLRALRFLEFNRKEAGDYIRLGKLAGRDARIGHGTLIDYYDTDADYDSPAMGMQFDWDSGGFGLETLIGSITEWDLNATRLYFRPLWASEIRALDHTTLGVTLVADWRAPTRVVDDNSDGHPDFSSAGNLDDRSTILGAVGADMEVPLIRGHDLELTPYFDFAHLLDHGYGLFFGLRGSFGLPATGMLPVAVRLEWRVLSNEFLAPYFDDRYRVERYAFPSLDADTTKLTSLSDVRGASGGFARIDWGIIGIAWWSASIALYDRDNDVHARLVTELSTDPDLPYLPVQLYARYTRRDFTEGDTFDDAPLSLFELTGSVELGQGVFLAGTWTHNFRLYRRTGRYEAADAWSLGLFYRLQF